MHWWDLVSFSHPYATLLPHLHRFRFSCIRAALHLGYFGKLALLSRFTAKQNILTTNKLYWVREQSLPLHLTPFLEFGKFHAWTVIDVVSRINGTPSRSATMRFPPGPS